MFGRKKKKNFDYEKAYKRFYNIYLSDFDNEESQYFVKLYNDIKLDYLKKIEANEIEIYCERARLERKIGKYSSKLTSYYLNVIITGLPILANGIIVAYSVMSNTINKFAYIVIFSILFYAFMLFLVLREMSKDEEWIFGLSLRVIEDIEHEMKEEKKLEQEKIVDEVAVTSMDRINKVALVLKGIDSLIKMIHR